MAEKSTTGNSFRSGAVAVAGHRLYWELHGLDHPGTVSLLHHGLGSVRSWRRQIPVLVDAGWQVLAYDRWGYGRSDPRPVFADRFLLRDAQEAFQLLDELQVGRTALIGHSNGGTIALLMAAMQPDRISRLVVVATHIYYEEKMRAGLRSIAEQARISPLAEALRKEHGERAADLTEAWIDHWLNSDLSELGMAEQLKEVTCPTLVIQGVLDEHATPRHAADIADGVKQGELWLIPAVGHMPPHEVPDEFNHRVVDFLSAERF